MTEKSDHAVSKAHQTGIIAQEIDRLNDLASGGSFSLRKR